MKTILDTIFEKKKVRVRDAMESIDVGELIRLAHEARRSSHRPRLVESLRRRDGLNIIAEFKKASPSKGTINDALHPAATAVEYQEAGARAVSVLTEEDFFRGSLRDLRQVSEAVSLPVLRKDFIFDEFQIYEAAAAGADAVLLIVAALDPERLRRLRAVACDELGMDALVEVHTEAEMETAASVGATLIGVNNRDLRSFAVSLDVSRRLAKLAPHDATLVSESGITSREEMLELCDLGYAGFLIGETLMRAGDPGRALRDLLSEREGVETL